jgi:hypothetical protein
MITTEVENAKVIKLSMSEDDAMWLRAYLQNAFGNELDDTHDMRLSFFQALTNALK